MGKRIDLYNCIVELSGREFPDLKWACEVLDENESLRKCIKIARDTILKHNESNRPVDRFDSFSRPCDYHFGDVLAPIKELQLEDD